MTSLSQLQSKKGFPIIFGLLAILLGIAAGSYLGGTPSMIEAGAIIAGIVIIVFIFADLDVGLVILIIMNYLRISQIGINYYGAPPTALPLTLLLLLAIAVKWLLTKEAPKGWMSGTILIGLYGIVVFLSMFVAEDFVRGLEALTEFVSDAVVAVTIMLLLQRTRSLRGVCWALIASGIFIATLNVFQFFTGTFNNFYFGFAQAGTTMQIVGEYSDYRIGGQIGDPNYFAEFLILIVPVAFYQIWAEKSIITKAIASYATIICTLALILTYSRGGFLALCVVAFFTLILRAPKLGQVLLILAMVFIVFRYIPTKYTDRIMTMVDLATNRIDPREEGSFRARTNAMMAAWEMFKDHPFFGVGIDNFLENYVEYSSKLGIASSNEPTSTHNLYLEIAAETGLAGLGTFGAILVSLYIGIRRSIRVFRRLHRPDLMSSSLGIGLALIGFFSSAMFIHASYPRFLWMMIGIGFSVPIVASKVMEENEIEEEERTSLKIARSINGRVSTG
ncbi:MAG: O-antigen ligase family protein [Anaerolineaceae bacterium]